jgi:hypothetical protein
MHPWIDLIVNRVEVRAAHEELAHGNLTESSLRKVPASSTKPVA